MSDAVAVNSRESTERSLSKSMPVLVWAIVIFSFSTSHFSAENNSTFIDQMLLFLIPGASAATDALLLAGSKNA